MLMRGVPREGKRVELTKGLSVHLPYGAAYGKNEDGDLFLLQFSQPLPKNYKESLFSADDEAEYRWRLNGFAQKSITEFPFTAEEMADSEEEWHQKLEQLLNDLAMQLTRQTETEEKEQEKHQEPETQVEEDEDGNTTFRTTIHLNLQTKLTGQNYQIIPLKGARSALLFKNLVQVGGWMTLTFINLNFMIIQGKKLGWYTAGVSVPGEEDGFERCIKVLTPILQSMEMAEDVPVTENGVREEEETKPAQPEKKSEQPKTPAPKRSAKKKQAQGRPKAVVPAFPKEGKMALTTFVELLSTDKIDYCDSRIGWDGEHYDVDNVTLAADNDIPNSQEIVQAFMEAFKTLEQDQSLRIPSDKVSPQLRNFLGDHVSHGFTLRMSVGSGEEPDVQTSGQFGGQAAGSQKMTAIQDVTGSVMLHMVLWEKLILQEPEKDHFVAYVDQGLAQGIPEWETYIRRLIAALRAIDGAEGEFALECRIFSDRESPYALRGYDAAPQEQMEAVPFDDGAAVSISGKTFVLTGDFAHDENDRDRVSWRITAKGGRVTTAVSGKTNYLVIGKLGNFGQKKVDQAKEQKAKGSDIKIIREDDLFRVLEGKPAASVKKRGTKKPNAPETDPNEAKKEQIEKKRKEAVEQYLKQVTADFKKKKQKLQKEIDALSGEKEQHQQELNSAGFFQFSRKSSLKQIIRGIDIQYAKKQSELEELKKQEEDAKKEPYFKIDRKIREELAKETEKIVYANLCKLSEKDQQLGSLIVSMLSMDPVTFPEILERAKLLEIDATSLRVANIMRKLGVCSGAVTKRLYLRGVFYEPKEYTGYYL